MKFKIFLINLDKSSDRLARCQEFFAQFNIEFERIPAVYGKDLSEQEITSFYDADRNTTGYKKELGVGELGCYLSHVKCWQKIVDEELDYALILEDDFKLTESFNDFAEIFPKLVDWDYVRIAYPPKSVAISDRVKLNPTYDLVYYKKVPINTLAQAVSNSGAKKLLANSKKVFRPIDVDMKHYWEKDIQIMGIDPPLIKAHNNFTSEIDKISGPITRKGNTSFWRNLRYIFNYKLKSKYHSFLRPRIDSFVTQVDRENK